MYFEKSDNGQQSVFNNLPKKELSRNEIRNIQLSMGSLELRGKPPVKMIELGYNIKGNKEIYKTQANKQDLTNKEVRELHFSMSNMKLRGK